MILTFYSILSFLLLFGFLTVLGYLFRKVLKYQVRNERITPKHVKQENRKNLKQFEKDIIVEKNKLLNSFIGKEILEVYYLLINYEEYDYGSVDYVDVGIAIKFNDNTWLNWLWVESYNSYFTGYYLDNLPIKSAVLLDKYNILSGSYTELNVTNSLKWEKIVNSTIEDILLYKQDGHQSNIGLEIKLQGKSIYFCSTEEPENEEVVGFVDLPISNDWTIVVFDSEIIKMNKRANYSINIKDKSKTE